MQGKFGNFCKLRGISSQQITKLLQEFFMDHTVQKEQWRSLQIQEDIQMKGRHIMGKMRKKAVEEDVPQFDTNEDADELERALAGVTDDAELQVIFDAELDRAPEAQKGIVDTERFMVSLEKRLDQIEASVKSAIDKLSKTFSASVSERLDESTGEIVTRIAKLEDTISSIGVVKPSAKIKLPVWASPSLEWDRVEAKLKNLHGKLKEATDKGATYTASQIEAATGKTFSPLGVTNIPTMLEDVKLVFRGMMNLPTEEEFDVILKGYRGQLS